MGTDKKIEQSREEGTGLNPVQKNVMRVYSGKCRMCDCGMATGHKDLRGRDLFTGDIVIAFTDDYLPDHLTVVISDQWQSYSNGKHELTGKNQPFVMGIKNEGFNSEEWKIMKVKDFSEVIDGEGWKDFGFSYKHA